MRELNRVFRLIIVAAVCVAMQGCAAHRTVKLSPAAAEKRMSVGENVVVALKNGKRYRAVIVEMTDTQLITRNSRYAWADISYVSHLEYDAPRSFFATVGGIYLVNAIGALLFILILENE